LVHARNRVSGCYLTLCSNCHRKNRIRERRVSNLSIRTPCSAVHWTLLFRRNRSDPFKQTMHMKYMSAFSPNWQKKTCKPLSALWSFLNRSKESTQWTIIARHFTRWTTPLKRYAANTTDITLTIIILLWVSSIPAPLCYGVPSFNDYLHWERGLGVRGWL
jgi:hypothetical protein